MLTVMASAALLATPTLTKKNGISNYPKYATYPMSVFNSLPDPFLTIFIYFLVKYLLVFISAFMRETFL